jgi:hypothetical protein
MKRHGKSAGAGKRIAAALRRAVSKIIAPSLGKERQFAPPTKWTDEQILSAVAEVRAGPKLTPERWPNDSRVAVCISVDIDNETLSLSRGETAPVALSAGEFGATNGLRRLLDLLDRHNIPSSFYIPAVSAMLHPQMIREIADRRGHEIGVHGWIHENAQAVNDRSEEQRLMNQAIDYLTKAVGKRPPWDFVRPHGRSASILLAYCARPAFFTTAA